MNKITKIGLSALCGSLASIATANAGELDVTGTAELSWTQRGGEVTGNPLGMNTGLTFKGSGELDGGQTFSVTMAHTDKATWSSSNITLTTNSLGTFKLSSAEGGAGIGGYDDIAPTAWEETWDGVATNSNFQKGVGSSTNVSWTTPVMSGVKFQIAHAPDNDGAQNTNKGVSGETSAAFGAGTDIVLDMNPQWDSWGFNLFLGGSRTELAKQRTGEDFSGDHEEAVVGLIVNMGPLEIGGQISAERRRAIALNTPDYYANTSWGIAFNVNDDLSVSYGEHRSMQANTHKQNMSHEDDAYQTINEYTPKSTMMGHSIQVAYTIGGVGLKYSDTEYDNTAYTFDNKVAKDAKILAVTLAF